MLFLLGETKRKVNASEQRSSYYAQIVRDYPLSPLVKDSKKHLWHCRPPFPTRILLHSIVRSRSGTKEREFWDSEYGIVQGRWTGEFPKIPKRLRSRIQEASSPSPRDNSEASILLADDSPTIQRLVAQTFADRKFRDRFCQQRRCGDSKIRRTASAISFLPTSICRARTVTRFALYVKKHAELGETPVVLLAGAFDAYDEETASQAGAAAHITKPFEPQALVNLVVSLLPKEARQSGQLPALHSR